MPIPNYPASPDAQNQCFKQWLYGAALLSAVAGIIHLVVTPEHFAEWLGYGLFFMVVTIAQLAYALLLLTQRPSHNLLLAGMIGNTLIIALYLVTHILGIPFFGPAAGEVEPVGVLDVLSKIAELGLIACLAVLWRTGAVREDRSHGRTNYS